MATVRIRVPERARKGEIVEIKTLVSHPMESGFRPDESGRPVPRKILNRFVCLFGGDEVLRADWGTVIAPNPYFTFYVRVAQSGEFEFMWTDDDGSVIRERTTIIVD